MQFTISLIFYVHLNTFMLFYITSVVQFELMISWLVLFSFRMNKLKYFIYIKVYKRLESNNIWKSLYAGTIPANKKYAAGTIPANNKYAAGTPNQT